MITAAAALALVGVVCLCASLVYYRRARHAHARADELTATASQILDASAAAEHRASDLLSRIQEHTVL